MGALDDQDRSAWKSKPTSTPPLPRDLRVIPGQQRRAVHPRCAGTDSSKKGAEVCVRIVGATRKKAVSTLTRWGSVTSQVVALGGQLVAKT